MKHPSEDPVQPPLDDLFGEFSMPSEPDEQIIDVPDEDGSLVPDGSDQEDLPDSIGDPIQYSEID